jgi:hypothetical protein
MVRGRSGVMFVAAILIAFLALLFITSYFSSSPITGEAARDCTIEPSGTRRDQCYIEQAAELARTDPEGAKQLCLDQIGDPGQVEPCLAQAAVSRSEGSAGVEAGATLCVGDRREGCLLDLARRSSQTDPQGAMFVCRAIQNSGLRDSCILHIVSTRKLPIGLAEVACRNVNGTITRERCLRIAGS